MSKIVTDNLLSETAYTAFFALWIAEVMRSISGTKQHIFRTKDVPLCFHKGKFPCDIRMLDGVSHNGFRLRFRDVETGPFEVPPQNATLVPDIVYSFPTKTVTKTVDAAGNVLHTETSSPTMYWNDLTRMPFTSSGAWYAVEPGHLLCSLKSDIVKLHYRALPIDDRGMPLIPDNQAVYDACGWYVRAKMIGTGRRDPVWGLDDRICMQRYVDARGEAQSQMDNQTPDMAAGESDVITRGYPPEGYMESFSTSVSPETYYL